MLKENTSPFRAAPSALIENSGEKVGHGVVTFTCATSKGREQSFLKSNIKLEEKVILSVEQILVHWYSNIVP